LFSPESFIVKPAYKTLFEDFFNIFIYPSKNACKKAGLRQY